MPTRKPQINFQVDSNMKALYREAKQSGYGVTRLCAAGFLMMVEEPATRVRALNRLREWEEEFESAAPDDIREFVQAAQGVLENAAPATRPKRKARATTKKARRRRSAK